LTKPKTIQSERTGDIKKRGAKVLQIASYLEALHASPITLYTNPPTLSAIQHIYFVYLLNTNSLNPKHLRQKNDRSELHLNPAIESLNRLINKSFFVSFR
jgi:hypothetical protein